MIDIVSAILFIIGTLFICLDNIISRITGAVMVITACTILIYIGFAMSIYGLVIFCLWWIVLSMLWVISIVYHHMKTEEING
jgi:hypothetical protein